MVDVRRIVIYGPESTGKTTLARSLARHFDEPWAPEYVRQFWDDHEGRIAAPDLEAIGRGQLEGEKEAERRSRHLAFCDTDLLTCRIWDDLLFPGACPGWVRREGDIRARGAALYLFCDTDLPFQPDPQRCFPDPKGRAMGRSLWQEVLERLEVGFVLIRGVGEERFSRALTAVKSLL